jgi:hypothetical protein
VEEHEEPPAPDIPQELADPLLPDTAEPTKNRKEKKAIQQTATSFRPKRTVKVPDKYKEFVMEEES